MKKRSSQSGQAMMELTIMLLALTGMMLAVILLNGYWITGHKMLLSARHNAQNNSSKTKSAEVSDVGNEFITWHSISLNFQKSYIRQGSTERAAVGTGVNLMRQNGNFVLAGNRSVINDRLPIPFSLNSDYMRKADANSVGSASSAMTSPHYSDPDAYDENHERFDRWKSLQDFNQFQLHNDFAMRSGSANAFTAASLVGGSPEMDGSPATIKASHQAGIHSRADAANVMYDTFRRWFGVKLSARELRDNPGNQVFIPANASESSAE